MLTIREQLQLMYTTNTAQTIAAARQQARADLLRPWLESLASIACGALIGLLIVWFAG